MLPQIHFRRTPLETLEAEPWEYTGFVRIEFFPGQLVSVRVTAINEPAFESLLRWVDDGQKMMLDLEWKPGDDSMPCVFQIGSKNGVLIVVHPPTHQGDKRLRDFLLTHEFYMKGMSVDLEKLKMRFGSGFKVSQFDDIHDSILAPLGIPLNFNAMIKGLSPWRPCARFKNKDITVSDWEGPLTMGQVIYAAFDVVGLAAAVEGSRMSD